MYTSFKFSITDLDLQHPGEVFRSIIRLPRSDRQEFTSLLLEMLSVSRDIDILNTNLVSGTNEPPHDKINKMTVRPAKASAQSDQSLCCALSR